jgi:Domain of unknown function (DUF1963)
VLPALPFLARNDSARSGRTARPRAPEATLTASVGELQDLAGAAGLGSRVDAIGALAQYSVRILVEPATGGPRGQWSSAGDRPATDPDRPTGAVLRLDLAEVAEAAPRSGAPVAGTLSCICEASGSWSLIYEPDGSGPSAAWPTGGSKPMRVRLSAELVLPRVWSESVQALGLDEADQDAWTGLRERLAALQHTDLPGEVDDGRVIHRLLGYPDERTGTMPDACELMDRGIDPRDRSPSERPPASGSALGCGRWRLLLQLSSDDLPGWDWGSREQRLYAWIDRVALASGDLSRLHTIIR